MTERRFFFVHMQKTAGTALRHGLINHFGDRAVYPAAGIDGTDPVVLVQSVDCLRERMASRGDEVRVITGHFPLCTVDGIAGDFTTLTLLRDPVERTLSYLRHHRENEKADREKSLEEIYADPFRFHGFAHNHMTKMLSMRTEEAEHGMLTPVELTAGHLERAKLALLDIDLFGLQERFEEFWQELTMRYELDLGEREIVNASAPVEVSEEFRAQIAEDNALDAELYQFAREELDRTSRSSEPARDSKGPSISVVIPTHQRAPLLERSLDSLAKQTLPAADFEVVVVDDGSTDWTASVCEKLADRLELRYLKIENSGIAAAKNLGVFSSRAPLILFFDDDDVADPRLLEEHIEAHGRHPEEHVAVLGHTTWSPELEITPVMRYVTDIGQQLFFYRDLEDGQELDYTFFWGGRSSCKRDLLVKHGSFDQSLKAMEDIELGFRLAGHGLRVRYAAAAKSQMIRPVDFDEFARRCRKRGRALWRFDHLHPDPEVEAYARVAESLETWAVAAPSLSSKVDRIRELESREELSEQELEALWELYGFAFEAYQAQGVSEAAEEATRSATAHLHSVPSGSFPAICPEPIFIIGSPRSGTSALAWALAQHTEFTTEPESDIFFYLLKDPHLEKAFATSVARPGGGWLGSHGVDLQDFLAHIGLGLNALLTSTSGGGRWVDQTPANTIVVDRIAQMFPGARFIHLIRDGRRVVHSMMNFHRAIGDDEAVEEMASSGRLPPWATDFRDACETWARLTRLASEFADQNPGRAHTVANERLITDPEETIGSLLEFLGVDAESAPAEFLRTQRINSSFAASGRSETGPPALTEPWRDWQRDQRDVFAEVAGPTMVECGLATEAELLAEPEPAV